MNLQKHSITVLLLLVISSTALGAKENAKKRPARIRNVQAQQPLVDYEEYYDENGNGDNGSSEGLEEGVIQSLIITSYKIDLI